MHIDLNKNWVPYLGRKVYLHCALSCARVWLWRHGRSSQGCSVWIWSSFEIWIYAYASTTLKRGVLVSRRPSVRPWTELCPRCISNNTNWINFLFTSYQASSENKYRVKFLQNSKIWILRHFLFNSFAPGKCVWNLRYVIFKRLLVIAGWGISCEVALISMSLGFTDDQSTLVQVMAWCLQATSHYLSQCWPRSLSPCNVTWPQWLKFVVDFVLFWFGIQHESMVWVIMGRRGYSPRRIMSFVISITWRNSLIGLVKPPWKLWKH